MAQTETYKINVESNAAQTTEEVNEAVKELKRSVDDVGKSSQNAMDDLGKGAKKAGKDVKKTADEVGSLSDAAGDISDGFGDATGVLDEFTDGRASQLKGIADQGVQMYRGITTFGKGAKTAFKSATVGANGMKKALISTGIGALIVGVGLLIAYWDDLVALVTGGTEEMTEAQKEYNEALIGAQAEAAKTEVSLNLYLDAVNDVTAAEEDRLFALEQLKKAGVETGDIDINNADALQILNDRVKDNIQLSYARAKANAASAYLEKELTRQFEAQNKSLDDQLAWYDKLFRATNPYGDLITTELALSRQREELSETQESVNRAQATYAEALEELVSLEGENLKTQTSVREELERRAKTDDAVAQALKDREEAEKRAGEMYAQVQKELEVLRAEESEKEIVRIKQNYEERIALITAQFGAESQELKELMELQNAEIQAVRDRQEEQRQAAIDKANEERKRKEKETQDELDRIDKEASDKKALRREQEYQMAKEGLQALLALNEAFAGEDEEQQRRAFAVQKALSAANVVVSTIEGAQNAYATAQKSPITLGFPAYPYIQAGLATAFGLAQLKQIQSQQFGGSKEPSSASAPGGGAPAGSVSPSFSLVGSSGANVIAESLSKTPLKAYVVGSEVTTQQELDRNRVKAATL